MPTRNVVLTEHQDAFIERLVREGRYQNASEVLRTGLRLVERDEAAHAVKVQALREAVQAGIASIERGAYREFEDLDALQAHLDEIGEAAIADLPAEH